MNTTANDVDLEIQKMLEEQDQDDGNAHPEGMIKQDETKLDDHADAMDDNEEPYVMKADPELTKE